MKLPMCSRALCAVAVASLTLTCGGCSGQDPEPFDDGSGAAVEGAGLSLRQAYPEPPFGTKVGAVIEDFRFYGWRDPKAAGYDPSQLEPISLADYFDPDGTSDHRYIAFGAMAVWCGVCRAEAAQIRDEGTAGRLRSRGALLMHSLFEDNDHEPATPADMQAWTGLFEVDYPFVLDNGFKLGAFFDKEATPMNLIIDTSTMRIVYLEVGWLPSGDDSMLSVLERLLDG